MLVTGVTRVLESVDCCLLSSLLTNPAEARGEVLGTARAAHAHSLKYSLKYSLKGSRG